MATKKTNKSDDSMFESENVGKAKPRKKRTKKVKKEVVTEESPVAQYVHPDNKRKNNPPVGMVDPNNDPDQPSKRYSYDPRLDPQLQWSGKTENSEFDVDTVSLHVHERIDPLTIIEKAMKEHKQVQQSLFNYFDLPENNPPLRDAIEFYKHDQNWSNRLIAGDSLLVMNSLLEKEGMKEKVQMIYIDPPYGITYGSNFQPYVKNLIVKDGKDEDLTQEPEMIKAFRDTWELGIHSYLSFLYNRIFLAKKLLTESGSCFLQISDENLHFVRMIMDEIFGSQNFVRIIQFRKKTMPLGGNVLEEMSNYLVWYAKDRSKIKFNQLYTLQNIQGKSYWNIAKLPNGEIKKLTSEEIKNHSLLEKGSQVGTLVPLNAPSFTQKSVFDIEYQGKTYLPLGCWITNQDGMKKLVESGRLTPLGKTLKYLLLWSDFPYSKMTNNWGDTSGAQNKTYVVQTSEEVLRRCIFMTTDPGDLVFDPTCGSGTTARVSEEYGRRWITCDTSRVAITLAKQRLLTHVYNYYELLRPEEGITSGFNYKKLKRKTARQIINDEPPVDVILFNEPLIDKQKTRISGPFTVEAVPSPTVKSIDALSDVNQDQIQTKITTQQEWRDELLKTGIRLTNNQRLEFSRVESHPTTKWLHVDAETKEAKPKRVMVSFGPEHSLLDQRQVAKAIEESQTLVPKPEIIIFAAMQFDPEAAKDIDELKWPGVTILKAEMNKDLQTQDLKKKQSTSESFWLMGSPDVECKKQKNGKYIVTVNGFDYYNTKTDEIESGGASKITMWGLDTDYDDRSVYPQQIFFPMDGKSDGWNKLAKTLQAYIDEDLITKYQGTESIPFEAGPNKRIAVKIIDDRGIESLKIIDLE
jgi:adenine-specific DNA-methyltransferase